MKHDSEIFTQALEVVFNGLEQISDDYKRRTGKSSHVSIDVWSHSHLNSPQRSFHGYIADVCQARDASSLSEMLSQIEISICDPSKLLAKAALLRKQAEEMERLARGAQ
jgi:hypothetical protein